MQVEVGKNWRQNYKLIKITKKGKKCMTKKQKGRERERGA